MKKIFWLFCFVIQLQPAICLSQKRKAAADEERYLVTTSGTHEEISHFIRVTADSLYYTFNDTTKALLMDDISLYHHYRPGKAGKGFWIGATIGLVMGGLIIPSVTSKESDYSDIGAGIGIGLGGLIGIFAGSLSAINIDVDLQKFSKQKKNQFFLSMIANP